MRDSVSIRAAAAAAILCLALAGCGDDNDSTTAPSGGAFSLTCSVAPTSGQAPLAVSLSTRLTPFVSASLVINYGDGTTGSNPNAAHVYRAAGNYTLAVTATNAAQSSSCQTTVTVSAPPPAPANGAPVLNSRTDPNPPTGPAPLDVGINLCQTVDPDGDRMVFHFDFGDGTRTSPGICRDRHVYSRGVYTAKACVTDGYPGHESCRTFNIDAQ